MQQVAAKWPAPLMQRGAPLGAGAAHEWPLWLAEWPVTQADVCARLHAGPRAVEARPEEGPPLALAAKCIN